MDKVRRLNRAEALAGDAFHWGECTRTHGPRGGIQEDIVRYRRMGASKVWKTRPEDFRIPVKYGARNNGSTYITPDNVEEFHLEKNCPLETAEYRQVLSPARVIEIVKHGGGTLGRRYDGDWHVVVADTAGRTELDDTLTLGTPKTHAEVVGIVLGHLDDES